MFMVNNSENKYKYNQNNNDHSEINHSNKFLCKKVTFLFCLSSKHLLSDYGIDKFISFKVVISIDYRNQRAINEE